MNIILIGNCQIQPLAYLLELSPDVNEVIQVPLHLKGSQNYFSSIKKIEESSERYTVFHYPGTLDGINFSNLTRNRFDREISYLNIYFSGLHPDTTYIGGIGKRFLSPLGDYHSRIIYLSYAKSYSQEKCLSKFSDGTYKALGYYEQWNLSSNELIKRNSNVDVKFAEDFLKLTTEGLTLLTINHPTQLTFKHIANKILNFVELDSINIPLEAQPNFLASNAFWPIYPNLDLSAKVKYKTGFYFKSADNFGKHVFSLTEFVKESYKVYDKFDINAIRKPDFYESQIDLI